MTQDIVQSDYTPGPCANNLINAELLDALKKCVRRLRVCSKVSGSDDWAIDGMCAQFDAAIAKAEGAQ